jgi:prevent-host-death family protein
MERLSLVVVGIARQTDINLAVLFLMTVLRGDEFWLQADGPVSLLRWIATLMIASVASIEVVDMIREAPAMTVRQNLGELLNEIQYRGDSVVITKSGKPVAALIDIDLFERLRTLDEEYARLRGELGRAFSNLPPEDGMTLIDEAVQAARGRG